MTTDAQPNPEGEWVPRYFSDFRRDFDSYKDETARQFMEVSHQFAENSRQFAEYKDEIARQFMEVSRQFAEISRQFTENARLFAEYKDQNSRQFMEFAQENARQHMELATRIEAVRGELLALIAHMDAENARRHADLLKWMVATLIGGYAAVAGTVFALARALG